MAKGIKVNAEWVKDAARIVDLTAQIKPLQDELEALKGKYKDMGIGEYGPITVENGAPRIGVMAKGPALVALQTALGEKTGKAAWESILSETVPVMVKVKA